MKKYSLILALSFLLSSINICYAINIENISNLTPEQKTKIAEIQTAYTKEYNENETKIMDYTNKLNQIKADTEKTADQISILAGAYERNLIAIKARQQQLKNETEEQYHALLTEEQYKEYQMQQLQVDNAFNEFLKK